MNPPSRVRLCPKHLTQPDDSRNNCWCGLEPVWYVLAVKEPVGDPADNQLGGFRGSDPPTSRRAALDNYPRSGSQRQRCLLYVLALAERGATASEVEEALDLPTSSVAKRLGELEVDGWLERTSRTRRTSRGSDGSVYIVPKVAEIKIREKEGIYV